MGFKKYLNQSKNYLSIRVFTTFISRHIGRDDYIIFADTSTEDNTTISYNGEEVKTIANNNLGNRYLYGGSLDGYFSISKILSIRGNLSIIEAAKSNKYGPLPSISPLFRRLFLQYQKGDWLSHFSYQFSDKKHPDDYSFVGEDGLEETPLITANPVVYAGTPTWSELSWLVQYRFKENTIFRVALDNIFDVHYRPFASGISAPGRNIKLGINYRF